jgi:hypothetical protein
LRTTVAGQEIYRDGRVSAVDESELRDRLGQVRLRIDSPA